MKKNVGNTDKLIRLVLAAVFVALFAAKVVSGTLGIVLLVLAGVFAVTALLGTCPIYSIVGLSTCPTGDKKA